MKRIWLTLVAAAVLSVAAFAPVAAQDTVTIDMKEVDGSGQAGSADITTDGEQVTVAIEIDAGEEGVPQPAHIHEGSCQDLGDVAYPLDPVEDGASESTADVSMSELLAGDYAINVHLSEDESDTHVSCGTLPLIGGGDGEEDDEASEDEDEDAADDEEDEAAEDEDEDATDEDGEAAEEDEDQAADDEDGEAAEEDEDQAADDEDGEAAEEDEDEAAEDVDEAAEDEDGGAAEEDEDEAAEDVDEAAEDEDEDDADEVAPATGSLSDPGAEAAVGIMVVLAGGALGAGLLVRRRAYQA